jgi:hypothetical protein
VNGRVATDSEMLAAGTRWAAVRGFVMHGRDGYSRSWTTRAWGLHVNPLPPSGTVLVCPEGDELRGVEVSPHAALVWALVVEAEIEPVDVGRCPACVERGGVDEWAQRNWKGFWTDPQMCQWNLARWVIGPFAGPLTADAASLWADHGHEVMEFASRPCPDCAGTGRDRREVARLLLDAQPRVEGNPAVYAWTKPGDPVSIEALTVLADRLQFPAPSDLTNCPGGRPRNRVHELLGEAIAHLLADRRERTSVVARLLRLAATRRVRSQAELFAQEFHGSWRAADVRDTRGRRPGSR